ncbi:MAG TPA: elongation factor P-like protein YeiP [Gammaproteobacteria bacterium]|nr:elongation factor P-like protein YeiP [Gammaproteobacteria bacterium]
MKANELRKGMVILVDGRNILIKGLQVQSPSSRSGSTLYKTKGQDVVTRQKFEHSFKGDEVIVPVEMERRDVQMLFHDAVGYTFMDTGTYEQYTVPADALTDETPYLFDSIEGVRALIADGVVLGIELPGTVSLQIVECAPGMKAASASARNKPATLGTGLVVQVPEYLTPGEVIKVNTDTGEFISRA